MVNCFCPDTLNRDAWKGNMKESVEFRDLGLSGETLQIIKKKGFEVPSPIQARVIPLLLKGDTDVVGQAQTGTGKTAAFGLPLMEKLTSKPKITRALVLTPTRELAIQVAEELISLNGNRHLVVLPVYGGQSISLQIRHLKQGVHIVVGTPGRILDHIRRHTLDLTHLEFCILDEADEMLNMGFLEDVSTILENTNTDKRTLLFSATMPGEILNVAKKHMGPYELIKVHEHQMTVAETDQIYFQVMEKDKFEALCRIIDMEEAFYGLIFCRTKVDADRIANRMGERGYDAGALHGDLSQAQREKIMDRFRKRRINVLVATDVAARGIDVGDLTHVINYALPQNPDAYVHRIGRTGRAGKEGTAITFITPAEERKLLAIGRKTRSTIRKENLPRIRDIIDSKKKRIRTDLENLIETGMHHDYLPMARSLTESFRPDHVVAAVLKYAFETELNPAGYNEIRERQTTMPGQSRLFIARGKKDGMTPKKLIHMITRLINMPAKKIQDVVIQDNFSYITVPFKEAEMILMKYRQEKKGRQKGGKPLIEMAKPRKKEH